MSSFRLFLFQLPPPIANNLCLCLSLSVSLSCLICCLSVLLFTYSRSSNKKELRKETVGKKMRCAAGEHPGDIRSVESIVSSAIMNSKRSKFKLLVHHPQHIYVSNSASNKEVKRYCNAENKHDVKDPRRHLKAFGISALS
jgi:hypothetical protein